MEHSAPPSRTLLISAWKYAYVLTGQEQSASALVEKVVGNVERQGLFREEASAWAGLFSGLYHESLPPADSEVSSAISDLHHLQEPARSALTLLCLGHFSGEALGDMLGLSEAKLAEALSLARRSLASEGSYFTE